MFIICCNYCLYNYITCNYYQWFISNMFTNNHILKCWGHFCSDYDFYIWHLFILRFFLHLATFSTSHSFPVSHTTQDLIFLWNMTDPLVVNPEIELPQLDISNNYTTDCTIEYSTGNFTCIQIVFNLRRRLGYHLFHTYIPSALIVVMSWIAFWIKPEAIPARVTLGVTSLLTLG